MDFNDHACWLNYASRNQQLGVRMVRGGRSADLSVPDRLRVTAWDRTEVDLAWSLPSGGAKVDFYRVYRDGVLLARTGAERKFSDRDPKTSGPDVYAVMACDALGCSALSEPIELAVPGAPERTR